MSHLSIAKLGHQVDSVGVGSGVRLMFRAFFFFFDTNNLYIIEISGVDLNSRRDQQGTPPLKHDGILYSETKTKANIFNQLFKSVFTP